MRPLFLLALIGSLTSVSVAAPVLSRDGFLTNENQTSSPNASLMDAAASGDTAKILESLKAGADVNARNNLWNSEFVESSTILIGMWGGPPLAIAAGKGRLEATQLLLEKGAEVDGRDSKNFTALIYAARSGNVEIVRLLLNKGADPNAHSSDGRTALDNAVRYRNYDICQLLIEKGADINYRKEGYYLSPALIEAIDRGQTKMVTLLLDKGADVNITGYLNRTALMAAASRGNVDLVKSLIAKGANVNAFDDNGWTALNSFTYGVAPETRQQIAQILRQAGATQNGWTPLMAAANAGELEKVRLALDQKADVNKKGGFGYSPLALAITHPKVVSFLIERGADVNSTDIRGRSSLILALDSGQIESALILLDNGADPDAKDISGERALSRAIQYPRAVAMLLTKGAKVSVKDGSGKTALDYALMLNRKETIDLLKNAGAKTGKEMDADTEHD